MFTCCILAKFHWQLCLENTRLIEGEEQIKTKQCINDKGNWIFQGGRTDKYLHAIEIPLHPLKTCSYIVRQPPILSFSLSSVVSG